MKRHWIAAMLFLSAAAPAVSALAPGDVPEGLTFKDIRYLSRTLEDFGSPTALLLLFHTADDAEALKRLDQLAESAPAGALVAAVDVTPDASIVEVAAHALELDGDYLVLKDFDGVAARQLGIEKTPSAVLLDAAKSLRYRGPLDDASAALSALLAGQPIPKADLTQSGKPLGSLALPNGKSLNFAEHIAPIINQHCVACHTPGEAAPFSLRTYKQVAARADMIAEVVREERMPPWYAAPEHGKFINERRIPDEDRHKLLAWLRDGMEKGNLRNAPEPPPAPESEWHIGKPDLILEAKEEDEIPATGYVDYKYVTLPHQFTEDTWVQGIELMPSNPSVVHHVNLAYNVADSNYEEKNNFLTGRVPGNPPVDIPGPVAMLIPRNSVLFLQIHYVTTGKEQKNRMRVGIRYAEGNILKRVYYQRLRPADINIPPGVARHRMESSWTVDRNALALALFSHMHVRGRDMSFFAKYPDGATETLLVIPNYSFDWQLAYQYVPATKTFPKGTELRTVSHYDNSPFNAYNPDPSVTVTYGEQTEDEMNDAYVFYLDADEFLNITVDGETGREIKGDALARAK